MTTPLPFTAEQFFGVFRAYHAAWGLALPALLVVGVAAVACTLRPWRGSDAFVSGALALLWLWTGLVYHLGFFAAINPLAPAFAAASLAGAASFAVSGLIQRRLAFRWRRDARSAASAALIAYALVLYPVGAALSGHPYPEMPTFGLPCPTTLFTIGLLGLLQRPHPRTPLVVPLAWCLVGMQAAFRLQVWPDLGLIPAAALAAWLLVTARHRVAATARSGV